jgi:hypothetical protein
MSKRMAGLALLTVSLTTAAANAQISMQPQLAPTVTAENRDWYLNGEPIAFGGGVYFPSGPIIHFSANEMVETGMFEGVPIYIRTTVERGSMVFVPLAGGVMRPYERRRTGDLAGTSGSSAPNFVVQPPQPYGQTSANPEFVYAPSDLSNPQAVGTTGYLSGMAPSQGPAVVPIPFGTMGAAVPLVMAPSGPTRIQTVQRPVGLNGVYVQYQNARWFLAGPAVELTTDRFTKAGEYRGFQVYTERDHPELIYVALIAGSPGLISPYKVR